MRTPVVSLAGGTFTFGDDHHYPEERPARWLTVAPFAIEVHAVTVGQFASFVAATGHVTRAEEAGGAVFVAPEAPVDLAQPTLWWRHDPTANWRCPHGDATAGPDGDHPVTQVDHDDAAAYAAWVGGRLPTEAEWEFAARGGQALPATWPLAADGMLLANVWMGEFPWQSTRQEPPGAMPVGAFSPNPFGLFDMLGNVWEWTASGWPSGDDEPAGSPCCSGGGVAARAGVAKGGSFLCAANYCTRYRPAARHRQVVNEAACHLGFRCAFDSGTQNAP